MWRWFPLALRGRKLGWWGGDPGVRLAPGRAAQGMHAAVIGDWRKAQWRKATRDGVPACARARGRGAPFLPPPSEPGRPLTWPGWSCPSPGGRAGGRGACGSCAGAGGSLSGVAGPGAEAAAAVRSASRRIPANSAPPWPAAPWPESGSRRPRLFSWLSGHVMDAGAALGASHSFPAPTRARGRPHLPSRGREVQRAGCTRAPSPGPNACTPLCFSPRCPRPSVQRELRALCSPRHPAPSTGQASTAIRRWIPGGRRKDVPVPGVWKGTVKATVTPTLLCVCERNIWTMSQHLSPTLPSRGQFLFHSACPPKCHPGSWGHPHQALKPLPPPKAPFDLTT